MSTLCPSLLLVIAGAWAFTPIGWPVTVAAALAFGARLGWDAAVGKGRIESDLRLARMAAEGRTEDPTPLARVYDFPGGA